MEQGAQHVDIPISTAIRSTDRDALLGRLQIIDDILHPERVRLLAAAQQWHLLYADLRGPEDESLFSPEGPSTEEVESHKNLVKGLIDSGKKLIADLIRQKLSLPSPYDTPHLKSLLWRIELDYELLHGDPMSPSESKGILEKAFGQLDE